MTHPTFRDLASDLVDHHPPQNARTGAALDGIRFAFRDLIDLLALVVPDGPDATIAARKIHDACQACIFAVVHNQETS
jgi:hypothetical protein